MGKRKRRREEEQSKRMCVPLLFYSPSSRNRRSKRDGVRKNEGWLEYHDNSDTMAGPSGMMGTHSMK